MLIILAILSFLLFVVFIILALSYLGEENYNKALINAGISAVFAFVFSLTLWGYVLTK